MFRNENRLSVSAVKVQRVDHSCRREFQPVGGEREADLPRQRRDAGVKIFDDPDKIKRGEMPLRFTRSTIAPWGSGCRLAGGIDAARAGQAVHWYAGIAQRDHRGRIGPSDMVVSNSPGVNSRSARHGRLGNRQTDEIVRKTERQTLRPTADRPL